MVIAVKAACELFSKESIHFGRDQSLSPVVPLFAPHI
jgi:hypothetical protein